MPEKWVDESITTRANRTPAQRAQDERAEELRHLDLTGRLMEGWKQHKAAIAKLEARIDTLHDLIEQQQAGARHLAGRIDRAELRTITLERAIERLGKGWREERQRIDKVSAIADRNAVSVSEQLANYQTRLNRLEFQAHRVREQFPSVAELTMQQQCDAVELRGPTEEG